MKKEAKKRTIYNNYDLWEEYEEFAREELAESGNKNPSNSEIWDIISEQDAIAWQEEEERLIDFFSGEEWILRGTVNRWDGSFESGTVFDDFVKMFYKITRSCDYFSLYDENGHMYLECSHHDGTNKYEIKKITDRGIDYLGNWEEKWNDKRTERQVHDTIMKRYSVIPHYAHTMYGCPKIEYEKVKENKKMSVNLSYEKIEYKMRELQIACEKYKETNQLADWVLNAIHRHIYTGRATNQFLYDFLNYPTYKFEILIKKCLNGDRSIEGITKTVKKVISKRK